MGVWNICPTEKMTLFQLAYFNIRKEFSFESSEQNARRDVNNASILHIEKSKKHFRNENASFSVNNKIIVFDMERTSRLSVSH